MIRNGLKTFVGNFMLVWKHALYLIIAFGITAALFVWTSLPIVDRLRDSGWLLELSDFFELFYTDPGMIADQFTLLATRLYNVLTANLGAIWGNYALSLILLFIVPSYVYYVGEYVLGECLGARMSSLHSTGFVHKLLSTFGRSSLYALWKTLMSLPFVVIIICLCSAYIWLVATVSGSWLLLPIVIAAVFLVLSCRYAFFGAYLPILVLGNKNIVVSFANAISEYTGGYYKKILYIWGLYLMELAAILFVGVFTLGAGLIIAIPSVIMVNVAVSFANYFQANKQNFYCAENVIIKPL